MSIQARLILWLLSLAIVFGALFGAYRYGRNVEGLARDAKERDALIEYAKVVKSSGEQHAKDQDTINRLGRELGGVRIHLPACDPVAGAHQDGAAGVFSARVDELFTDLQARAGELVQRCDQLNIDAIQQNGLLSGEKIPPH